MLRLNMFPLLERLSFYIIPLYCERLQLRNERKAPDQCGWLIIVVRGAKDKKDVRNTWKTWPLCRKKLGNSY